LIVAIGTESIRVVRNAKETLRSRYQLGDKFCRVHYLLIDTDTVAEEQDNPLYEKTYQVQLADDKGKENMRLYKERIITPQLEDMQKSQILPEYLTSALLEHELLKRAETGEANKNPLKGYFYLLANLRRIISLVEYIQSQMDAQNCSIYIMYSPISGTAAGAWFLITTLLFQKFKNSSPVLINLMPSRLKGDAAHRNRNYAIFGWSTRLLDMMIHQGITLRWTIPQLTGESVTLAIEKRQPLYALLQSAYRNQGHAHLATDEFFQVMAELLCLSIIGKQNGQGPPSIDSQITNTETDQRMEEIDAPDKPTRRFASRGYCAVRYNGRLAKEVTRMGVKDAVLKYLLPVLPFREPLNQPTEETATQQVPDDIGDQTNSNNPDITTVSQQTADNASGESDSNNPDVTTVSQQRLSEVSEHVLAYVRRQVQTFYGEWNDRAFQRAFAESLPATDLDRTFDELCRVFHQDLTDFITNLRGDGTDEVPIRQPIWEVLQNLLEHYGYELFTYLSGILDSIHVNDAFIMQQLPELAAEHDTIGAAIEAAREKIELYRTRLTVRGRQASTSIVERNFHLLLNEAYNKILLETLEKGYSVLLNDALRYFVGELQRLKQRLETIYEENDREYEPHRKKLHRPISAYLDERSYGLAKEKIEKYRRNVILIIRELFQGINDKLDRHHLGQQQLSNKIDLAIMNQEGIGEFPKDVAGVVRRVAANQNLLTQLLNRGRALTKLKSTGYEKNWCIWHSGTLTPALREALGSLQQSINNILSDETFKIVINDGPLPLRSKDDIELVLSETILDFPLRDVETDKSMEDYWDHDDTLFNDGSSTSVHRVHTNIVPTLQAGRKRNDSPTAPPIEQEMGEPDRQEHFRDMDDGAGINFVKQDSDQLSEEDIVIVASRLGIDPEEIRSKLENEIKR
jgi:hypothetical protein